MPLTIGEFEVLVEPTPPAKAAEPQPSGTAAPLDVLTLAQLREQLLLRELRCLAT
jgi:hypothetical protein